MLDRLELPPWLKAGLSLPLLVLNLWVLRQQLLPLAPFPALIVTAAERRPMEWCNSGGSAPA